MCHVQNTFTEKIICQEKIRIVDTNDDSRRKFLGDISHLKDRIFLLVNDLLFDFEVVEVEQKSSIEIAFASQRSDRSERRMRVKKERETDR